MTTHLTALADVLAKIEKATPGPWHTKSECPGHCCWHLFQPETAVYSGDAEAAEAADEIIDFTEMSEENAAAIAAAVNFLREHGARIEADARDAERYRWLRDEAGETLDGPYIAGKKGAPFAGEGWLTGEHADAAIDAARGGDGGL